MKAIRDAQRRQPWDKPFRGTPDRRVVSLDEDYEVEQLISSYMQSRNLSDAKVRPKLRELLGRYQRSEQSRARDKIEAWLDQNFQP